MHQKIGIAIVIILAAVVLVGANMLAQLDYSVSEPMTAKRSACSGGNDIVKVGHNTVLGGYLTDPQCKTLYAYANDKPGESACTDACAKTWKPYEYAKDSKDLSKYTDVIGKRLNIVKRKDGTYQYAYGNKALYYFKDDAKPGDTNGNGKDSGNWSVIPFR